MQHIGEASLKNLIAYTAIMATKKQLKTKISIKNHISIQIFTNHVFNSWSCSYSSSKILLCRLSFKRLTYAFSKFHSSLSFFPRIKEQNKSKTQTYRKIRFVLLLLVAFVTTKKYKILLYCLYIDEVDTE